jgi:ribosome assembly protein YihI (activator of Der GTPase)
MANRPKPSAKNVEGDFGKFTDFMKRLVAVPHSEIKAKLDAEKRAKKRKAKTSASRASGESR